MTAKSLAKLPGVIPNALKKVANKPLNGNV